MFTYIYNFNLRIKILFICRNRIPKPIVNKLVINQNKYVLSL